LGIGKPAVSNPNGLGAASGTFARLDLTGANVATLYDDPTSWPRSGRLILQNFVYQYLVPCEPPDPRLQDPQLAAILFPDGWHRKALKLSARDRIDWLRRQPEDDLTNAQPWVQLAKVLKDAGDENGAKEVLYEYNRVLARPENVLRRAATWPVDLLQKQPLWVAVPIAALTGLSSLVFWRAHRMRAMVPTDKDARSPFVTKQPLPDGYPPFNPIVYSLENVLPVIKLGQDSAWAPYAQALPATWLPERPAWLRNFANRWRFTRWLFRLSYSRLALLRWTLILLGWVLAGILTYAIGQRFEH
jgi:hypothetical protein